MAGVEGRVVAVTGAGGGIGREHALLLAECGARVVVNDLGGARDGSGGGSAMADETVTRIRDAGGEAVASYDDVGTAEGGAGVVQAAVDAFGRIDAVVCNAGILRDRSFHKMSQHEWEAVIAVHLSGTYHVVRAAWPRFRDQGYGRVVVTTSTSGIYGNFGQANYAAAKLGVVGLIHTLAIEGERHGITANAVAPVAATRMTEDVLPEELYARLEPAYVAPAVAHLASEECTDSGEIILAAGGRYARIAFFQSAGVEFDRPPTVDEIAASWPRITDLADARPGRRR